MFLPGAPNPMSGDVAIVKWGRLKILDIIEIDAMLLYKKFGVNAKKILADKMNVSAFDTQLSTRITSQF